MPRIEQPADWLAERLRAGKPSFAVRINDGEMIQMFRTRPEGSPLGTSANFAPCRYDLGRDLRRMMAGMYAAGVVDRESLLVGCSWGTERADDLAKGPFAQLVEDYSLEDLNWCNEHWPLDGVVDGSTRRLLEAVRKAPGMPVLVACPAIMPAAACLESCIEVLVPAEDSWTAREDVLVDVLDWADDETFLWCAGAGLKPTAWRIWRERPRTTHVDLGHLFNGALGLRDYGWLERGDGPWHEAYFKDFAPWVRSYL